MDEAEGGPSGGPHQMATPPWHYLSTTWEPRAPDQARAGRAASGCTQSHTSNLPGFWAFLVSTESIMAHTLPRTWAGMPFPILWWNYRREEALVRPSPGPLSGGAQGETAGRGALGSVLCPQICLDLGLLTQQ